MRLFTLNNVAFIVFTGTSYILTHYQEIHCPLRLVVRPWSRSLHAHDIPLRQISSQFGTSTNWSGYAVATSLTSPKTGSVSYVTGSWVVPRLSASKHNTYSASWVGIDGYSSATVEQLGTEHDWIGGKQHNYAWFEIYPQFAYEFVGFPVKAGDSITASVTYKNNGVFLLSISNNTRHITTRAPTSKTTLKNAQRNSAEWVMEAPASAQGKTLPLAHFGKINFSNCYATINGKRDAIGSKHWKRDAITMVTSHNTLKASTTGLTAGKNFSVTFKNE